MVSNSLEILLIKTLPIDTNKNNTLESIRKEWSDTFFRFIDDVIVEQIFPPSLFPFSEPSFPGLMFGYKQIGFTLGDVIITNLHMYLSVIEIARICFCIPIITMIVLCWVN